MDATDRAIVAALRENARMTNVELADRINLTPGPTLRRVQRLEADGVIQGYRAMIDPTAVGRGFEVMVDIELTRSDSATARRVEETLLSFDEVIELRRMFGFPDYFARVAVPDLESYETFHMDRMLNVPGIGRTNSRFSIATLKSPRA